MNHCDKYSHNSEAEQTFLNCVCFSKVNYNHKCLYISISFEFQSIPAAKLFRSNYSKKDTSQPGPPSTQNYTVISIGTAYALFGVLCLLYALIVTLIKVGISKDFKSSSSHWNKLRHILGPSMSLPNNFNHQIYRSDLPILFMARNSY